MKGKIEIQQSLFLAVKNLSNAVRENVCRFVLRWVSAEKLGVIAIHVI